MHITELNQELLDELKEYIECNEQGHVLTKKKNTQIVTYSTNAGLKQFMGKSMRVGDNKTKVGQRRGCKSKRGWRFTFCFPSSKESIMCNARDIIWVFNRSIFDSKYKVVPINGDLFDDRLENLELVKNNNGRPPKGKDSFKRKRNSTTYKQDKEIIKLRKQGLSSSKIAENMQLNVTTVKGLLRTFINQKQMKPFFNTQLLKTPIDMNKKQVGVYVIYAASLDGKNYISKAYIGSSVCIQIRLQGHFNLLEKNKHYNKDMQKCFNSGNHVFKSYLIEECKEGEELDLETGYINRFDKGCLFNKWSQPPFEIIKPFLDKAIERIDESKYTVTESGCWEWHRMMSRGGYSREMQIRIDGNVKHIKPHRASYYKYNGEYPELIRHMCDNRLCINPDHLEKGSHRQNGLDKSRQLRKDFEYWWLRYEGDVVKLTEHFGFKENQRTSGGSNQIYYWEKGLGLREKYPDVWYTRSRKLCADKTKNLFKCVTV